MIVQWVAKARRNFSLRDHGRFSNLERNFPFEFQQFLGVDVPFRTIRIESLLSLWQQYIRNQFSCQFGPVNPLTRSVLSEKLPRENMKDSWDMVNFSTVDFNSSEWRMVCSTNTCNGVFKKRRIHKMHKSENRFVQSGG